MKFNMKICVYRSKTQFFPHPNLTKHDFVLLVSAPAVRVPNSAVKPLASEKRDARAPLCQRKRDVGRLRWRSTGPVFETGESSIMVMTGGWFVVVLPTLLSLSLYLLNLEISTGILNNFWIIWKCLATIANLATHQDATLCPQHLDSVDLIWCWATSASCFQWLREEILLLMILKGSTCRYILVDPGKCGFVS